MSKTPKKVTLDRVKPKKAKRHQAVIKLKDQPDGKLGISIVFSPAVAAKEPTHSPAIQAAMEFVKMIADNAKGVTE